jgi:hypothetical protein
LFRLHDLPKKVMESEYLQETIADLKRALRERGHRGPRTYHWNRAHS